MKVDFLTICQFSNLGKVPENDQPEMFRESLVDDKYEFSVVVKASPSEFRQGGDMVLIIGRTHLDDRVNFLFI